MYIYRALARASPSDGAGGLLVASLAFLLLAMFTEPGIVPTPRDVVQGVDLDDDEDAETDEGHTDDDASSAGGRRKPPPRRPPDNNVAIVDGRRVEFGVLRAKMCRQTDNCVESFDHFCPWVGNAVGRRNYWLFVSFVTSVCLLALAVGATSVVTLASPPPAKNATHGAGFAGTALVSRGLGAVVLCLYTAIVLCSVCGLWGYHAWLIASNLTTNEAIKGAWDDAPVGANGRRNPHDRGAARNCAAFLARARPQSRVAEYSGASGLQSPNSLFDAV